MNTVKSFEPIADQSARLLILGSMPGELSLKHQQYYAHPRNAFWCIMAELFQFNADAPYRQRTEALKASGVALWDVLHACVRPGSLDSSIETGSRVANDLPTFLADHPHIEMIAFNGTEAEKSFNRYVQPHLSTTRLRLVRLPSTSPAHAVAVEKKIAIWQYRLGLCPNQAK